MQSLHDALHGEDGKTLYLLYQDLAAGAVEYNANDPMDKLRMNIMVAESNPLAGAALRLRRMGGYGIICGVK